MKDSTLGSLILLLGLVMVAQGAEFREKFKRDGLSASDKLVYSLDQKYLFIMTDTGMSVVDGYTYDNEIKVEFGWKPAYFTINKDNTKYIAVNADSTQFASAGWASDTPLSPDFKPDSTT